MSLSFVAAQPMGLTAIPSGPVAILVLLPLAACVYMISWSVRSFETSMALAVVSTLPLLAVVRWLWLSRRQALLVVAPYLFFHAATAVSAALIESGAYMPELADWGSPNGTAARIVLETSLLFWVIGLAAGVARGGSWTRRRETRTAWWAEAALLVLAAALLLLPAFNLIRLGIPLLSGLDRTAFYQEAGPLHLRLIILLLAVVPTLSLLAIETKSAIRRKAVVTLIVALLAVMVLTAEKFTGLIFTVYAAALPPMLLNRTAALKRILIAALGVLAASVALIVYQYAIIYQALDVSDFAAGRLAGQAQVPWAIDIAVERGSLLSSDDFVGGELIADLSRPQGIERLMLDLGSRSFVVPFIESGSRFTMGFPAILKLYFAEYGVLLIPIFGAVIGLFVRLILHCFSARSLFALWMSVNLFGYGALFDHIMFAGNLYQLGYFEATRLAWVALLLMFLFPSAARKVRRESPPIDRIDPDRRP